MMSKKLLSWVMVITVVLVATLLVLKHQYVLDSDDLAKAMSKELPIGTTKAAVLNFIQRRHPMFCDDLGSQVKTRFSGRAET
jgi:hypothetical protein